MRYLSKETLVKSPLLEVIAYRDKYFYSLNPTLFESQNCYNLPVSYEMSAHRANGLADWKDMYYFISKLIRERTKLSEKLTEDQDPPIPNDGPSMHDLVIEDLKERKEFGQSRYGTVLQTFNGRDPLKDGFQEILDLAVYLRQALGERPTRDSLLEEIESIVQSTNIYEISGAITDHLMIKYFKIKKQEEAVIKPNKKTDVKVWVVNGGLLSVAIVAAISGESAQRASGLKAITHCRPVSDLQIIIKGKPLLHHFAASGLYMPIFRLTTAEWLEAVRLRSLEV